MLAKNDPEVRFERMPDWLDGDVELCVSALALARLLDIQESHVMNMTRRGLFKKDGHGKYPLVDNVHRYAKYMRSRMPNGDASLAGGKDADNKSRMMAAKAEIAEMEAKKMRGELVEVEVVTRTWVDLASNFRARMLAVPHKLAPLVAVESDIAACHDKIENEINDALNELVNDDGRDAITEDGESGARDTAATAENDVVPMG